jgi:hypothetical protein
MGPIGFSKLTQERIYPNFPEVDAITKLRM